MVVAVGILNFLDVYNISTHSDVAIILYQFFHQLVWGNRLSFESLRGGITATVFQIICKPCRYQSSHLCTVWFNDEIAKIVSKHNLLFLKVHIILKLYGCACIYIITIFLTGRNRLKRMGTVAAVGP